MDYHPQTIIDSIVRFCEGNIEDFNVIYEGCYKLVYTTCYGIIKDEEDARDVTQDVFVKIYEKLCTLDNPAAYGRWMKLIASNMSLDHLRRSGHTCNVENDSELDVVTGDWEEFDSLPNSFIEEEEKRQIINKVLKESLSEVQYQTLFMFYFSEMPLASIAESMNCPEGTVKTRLLHAKEKFRRSLEGYLDDNKLVLAAFPFLTRFFNANAPIVKVPPISSLGIPGLTGPAVTGAAAGAGQVSAVQGLAEGAKAGHMAAKAGFLSSVAGKVVVGGVALALVGTAAVVAINMTKKDKPEETEESVVTTTDSDPAGTPTAPSTPGTGGTDGSDSTDTTDPVQAVDLNAGDEIIFGNYAGEDIKWIVLDETDDGVLLLSKYAIEAAPYNNTDSAATWEDCTLRKWLNDGFYNEAFNDVQKAAVIEKTNSNPDNPSYGTDGGNDTQDYVFLLSVDEASRYFSSDDARKAPPAERVSDRLYVSTEDNSCDWWLRTPGDRQHYASIVSARGNVFDSGMDSGDNTYGVRPAIWVSKTGVAVSLIEPETAVKKGDYVILGHYEQDGDRDNGPEDIEWLVLDEVDGKVLLISKDVLAMKAFNNSVAKSDWETCSLRRWLNNDFYNAAFSDEDKGKIIDSVIRNPANPGIGGADKNDTEDRVFIISLDEALECFSSEEARKAAPAKSLHNNNPYAYWWLRTQGYSEFSSVFVFDSGDINPAGYGVDEKDNIGVRPAVWADAADLVPADRGSGVRVFDSPASTVVNFEESVYDFKIPMVTIEGVNTDEANNAIEKEISKYLSDKYMHELKSRYVYFMNDKIVSIIVYNDYTWFDDDWMTTVFNIDLKTGKLLEDGEVIKLCGLTDKEFFKKVKTIYTSYIEKGIAEHQDYPNAKSFYEQNRKRVSYRYIDPYIGPDGHLCFAGYVTYIGGGGGAPVLFDSVTETWHF